MRLQAFGIFKLEIAREKIIDYEKKYVVFSDIEEQDLVEGFTSDKNRAEMKVIAQFYGYIANLYHS